MQRRRRELFPEHGPRTLDEDVRTLRDAELQHRQHRARRAIGKLRPRRSDA